MKLKIVSMVLIFVMAGCSKNDDGKNSHQPPTTPVSSEKENNSRSRFLDSDKNREQDVSKISSGKMYFEITSNIETDLRGATLMFQDGDIQRQSDLIPNGISCSIELKRGVKLRFGEQLPVNWLSENGAGSGNENGSHIHSTLTFDVANTDFDSVSCDYLGDDLLFTFKVSDLDKTFGKWVKLLIER